MDFTGKNILITGGSRGIGKATAIAFAERGGRVCINFLKNKKAAKTTIDSLAGEGHFAAKSDMSAPHAVEQLMETVISEFGTLDIVVNNAGIYIPHSVTDSDYEEWQSTWNKTLGINLLGAANACYFASRQMIKQGAGHIINVSSRGAFRGAVNCVAYGVSKAGMNSLTQTLALELGKHGISVTAVAPGYVETDMAQAALAETKTGDEIRNQSPMGRVATPEEIANAILFLASEKSVFVTGGIIDVNGASYLR